MAGISDIRHDSASALHSERQRPDPEGADVRLTGPQGTTARTSGVLVLLEGLRATPCSVALPLPAAASHDRSCTTGAA